MANNLCYDTAQPARPAVQTRKAQAVREAGDEAGQPSPNGSWSENQTETFAAFTI